MATLSDYAPSSPQVRELRAELPGAGWRREARATPACGAGAEMASVSEWKKEKPAQRLRFWQSADDLVRPVERVEGVKPSLCVFPCLPLRFFAPGSECEEQESAQTWVTPLNPLKMGVGSQKWHRNSPVPENNRNGLEKSSCKQVEPEENREKGPRGSWARNHMGNVRLVDRFNNNQQYGNRLKE